MIPICFAWKRGTLMAKFFGTPDGTYVGQTFENRVAASQANIHRPTQGGIHGNKREGADSIVVSGGYPDDEDDGDVILYTGHGGRVPGSRFQSFDQSPDDAGNAGLITSQMQGYPVRVIRGPNSDSIHAPASGYRYDGLFVVTDLHFVRGRDGFLILQFRLERVLPSPRQPLDGPSRAPIYSTAMVSRRIRDSALSRALKIMYEFKCQVCATRIPGRDDRFYSEGAHIRPLGRPHLGGDSLENILSLCPNHHAQLDFGGMVILGDFTVALSETSLPFGQLTFKKNHKIAPENITYHREMWQMR